MWSKPNSRSAGSASQIARRGPPQESVESVVASVLLNDLANFHFHAATSAKNSTSNSLRDFRRGVVPRLRPCVAHEAAPNTLRALTLAHHSSNRRSANRPSSFPNRKNRIPRKCRAAHAASSAVVVAVLVSPRVTRRLQQAADTRIGRETAIRSRARLRIAARRGRNDADLKTGCMTRIRR